MHARTLGKLLAMLAFVALAACTSEARPITQGSAPSTSSTTTELPTSDGRASTTTSGTSAARVSTSVGASTTLPPLTPDNAPLVAWNGRQQYIHGANLPWYNYGSDFGGGSTGGGVSSPDVQAAVGRALLDARASGMNVVRWWLFPGQPTQFVLDGKGLPTALSANVYTDIDAALALAKSDGLAYIFTLFSGPTALPASWITTSAGREQLASVLGGLFAHYRDDPQIMTWDVINEPEIDVWAGKARADDLRTFIAAIVSAVHANTAIPATVGGARLDGLPPMIGLGLDYYTIHWYDEMRAADQCLACTTYAEVRDTYEIDKPIVVGEFYGGPDLPGRFELWRRRGYAGALAWSLLPARTNDHLAIDLSAARAFGDTLGTSRTGA